MRERSSSKKKRAALILGISLIAFAGCISLPCLSWFVAPATSKNVSGMTGEATGSYFNGGDGSADKPYEIDNARQLYYFNWLQDLGYFNKHTGKTEDGSEDSSTPLTQVYFKLTSDIDAKNLVLPPAGTKTYPFIGNFDGAEHVISNLTISNKMASLSSKPDGAKFTNDLLDTAEIVGYFGIIGQYAETLNYTVKNTADDGTVTYVNEVSDLYFDNLTIESGASSVLAGFIVGYANGQVDNCGVQSGQFSFNNGVSTLNDGTLAETSLSKYALIGDCTDNLNWNGRPGSGSSGGSGTNWGASINMETLNRRINYMVTSYTEHELSGTGKRFSTSSRFNLYARYGQTTEWYWNDTSKKTTANGYANLTDGTILPLSIDTSKAFQTKGVVDDEITKSLGGNTYHTTSFYEGENAKEDDAISSSNTGYFVGGGTMEDNGTIYSDKGGYLYSIRRLVSLSMENAGQSTTAYEAYKSKDAVFRYIDTTGSAASEGELVLTKDSDGKITGNSQSYVRANDVINQYNDAMNGKIWAHGLRFYGTNNFTDNYTDYVKANLGGKKYSNYKFVKSGLNFTVKSKGYITTIVSTVMDTTVMFELFKVTRDGCSSTSDCSDQHSITAVKQIKQIYKYEGSDGTEHYYYTYSDGSSEGSNGTLVFDFDKISLSTTKALYYFEIPVEPGDYVIGKTGPAGTGNTYNSAYVTYLDIGNSGNEEETPTTDIDPTNIDFVYKSDGTIVKITDENYVPSGVIFAVNGSPDEATGMIYFKRNTSTGGVFYYFVTSFSVSPSGVGKSTKKDNKEDFDGATA